MEEDIQLGIVEAFSSKVVMTGMAKVNGDKTMLCTEVMEKSRTVTVLGITIGISSDIYRTGVGRCSFINENIQ